MVSGMWGKAITTFCFDLSVKVAEALPRRSPRSAGGHVFTAAVAPRAPTQPCFPSALESSVLCVGAADSSRMESAVWLLP